MPIGAALLAPLISAGSSIVGGVIKHISDRGSIRKMNKYNSPIQQVQRTRAAGLPAAALANAGNQTQPAQSGDLGFSQAGGHIGSYITNKKTLEDINKIKADVENQKLINQKLAAELDWYKAGAGTDPSRTNLSSMLALEQQMKGLQNIGTTYANEISKVNAGNAYFKMGLDNQEQQQRINNMINQYKLGEINIEGAKLDNALKDISRKWTPLMNQAQLNNLLKQHDIMIQDEGLKKLQNEFEARTMENKVTLTDIERANNQLGLNMLGLNYEANKGWQQFNEQTRKMFTNESMTWREKMDALGGILYQTFANPQGSLQVPSLNRGNTTTINKSYSNTYNKK